MTERKKANGAAVSRSALGRENVARWNADQQRYLDLETKVAEFTASLDERYGPTPAPLVVALKAGSTASYAALLLLQRRILRGRGRYCTTEDIDLRRRGRPRQRAGRGDLRARLTIERS
jgi:hypothetical protein